MDIDLDELERKAQAARDNPHHATVGFQVDYDNTDLFLQAATPRAVLELIERLRKVEADKTQAVDTLRRIWDVPIESPADTHSWAFAMGNVKQWASEMVRELTADWRK